MSTADEHLAASFDILRLLSANAAGDLRAGCMTPARKFELADTLGELRKQLLDSLPPPDDLERQFDASC